MPKLDVKVAAIRKSWQKGTSSFPESLQGVTKQRIEQVLTKIDRNSPDMIDGVFALLDNINPSWFGSAYAGAKICQGASTAHLACHIGILQRGKTKLDREGRDYFIKPLRDLTAIEPVYLNSKSKTFLPGHPIAKSPNSAYRLSESFRQILMAPEDKWEVMLSEWIKEDKIRERAEFQATLAKKTASQVDTKHHDLIQDCVKHYAPRFLEGFNVLYVDDSDGDRVSDEERKAMQEAGISFDLSDAMPDVLLWSPELDAIWIIEAVTSDGEVDEHKVHQCTELAERCNKTVKGFTTAYTTWKSASARQGKNKNISLDTYLWIREDPSKHFLATDKIL